jgi:hypothetical protein
MTHQLIRKLGFAYSASSFPVQCLKNIQLKFLPVNTTSLVQAMDMGIIKNLKMYRRKLVNHNLDAIEENLT